MVWKIKIKCHYLIIIVIIFNINDGTWGHIFFSRIRIRPHYVLLKGVTFPSSVLFYCVPKAESVIFYFWMFSVYDTASVLISEKKFILLGFGSERFGIFSDRHHSSSSVWARIRISKTIHECTKRPIMMLTIRYYYNYLY